MSRLLTVFGATGLQGGSLVNYVLEHPVLSKQYRLRGITRDTSKPAAEKLKNAGLEVVKADMDDPASLLEALKDSYAVFAVTNFWEKMSVDIEIAQGKAMADAAVAVGAKLLIWSSLANISKVTNGKVKHMVHFDSKALVEDYVRTLPILSAFYMAGMYMQNDFITPQKVSDGEYAIKTFFSRTSSWPMIDITDTGAYIAPALLEPERYNGKNFAAATRYMDFDEQLEVWRKLTGKKFTFQKVPVEEVLPPAMVEHLSHLGMSDDFPSYYGPQGEKMMKWTREQVEAAGGKLTEFEDFVKRDGLALLK